MVATANADVADRAATDLAEGKEHDRMLVAALGARVTRRYEPWTVLQLIDLGPRARGSADRIATLLGETTDDATIVQMLGKTLWAVDGPAAVATAYDNATTDAQRRALLQVVDDAFSTGKGTQAQADAVLPMLKAALASSRLRIAAIVALRELGPRAQAAVPAMARMLRVANTEVKAQLAYALVQIGAEQATNALFKQLGDADLQVQIATARALGCQRNDTIVGRLTQSLADADDAVKTAAALALSHQGEHAKPAATRLIALLDSPNEALRVAAADAIGAIGPSAKSAVGPLERGIATAPGPEINAAYAMALGRVRGTATLTRPQPCPRDP